jgi:hypothetical protein
MLWALTLHSRLARYSPSAGGAIAAYVIWLILGPPLPLVDIQHKTYRVQPANVQLSRSGGIDSYSFVALIGSQSGPRSHLERARGPFYVLPFKHFVAVLGTVRTLFAPPSPEENFPCPHLPPPLLPYRPCERMRNTWRATPLSPLEIPIGVTKEYESIGVAHLITLAKPRFRTYLALLTS